MSRILLLLFATLPWTGNLALADDPHIVFLVSEPEYQTEVTLPAFVEAHLKPLGYRVDFIFSSKEDDNRFESLEPLKTADVVVVSVRRRTPPVEQMEEIKAVLNSDVGLVGIRTACHAFSLRNKSAPEGHGDWPTMDADVWGGSYTNHYKAGPTATITLIEEARKHPVLRGINVSEFSSQGSLYMVAPVNKDATLLAFGKIDGEDKEPVAWVRNRGQQRVFFTSLGYKTDFDEEPFLKMLVNAIQWSGRIE